jgi:hypothetical protein
MIGFSPTSLKNNKIAGITNLVLVVEEGLMLLSWKLR